MILIKIGRLYSERDMLENRKYWTYAVQNINHHPYFIIDNNQTSAKFVSPLQISGILLKHLKEIATGKSIINAVITVPAHFNN